MLSIIIGKNQSTEARGALYIPTYEYNYKVITRGDQYYNNITSPEWRNCESTKIYINKQSKGTHEFTKVKLERHTRGLEG